MFVCGGIRMQVPNSSTGVEYNRKCYDHSREGPVRQPSAYQITKQLKNQEKVLRDHNLVMGPMNAFSDYYNTANYGPH